MSHPHPHLAEIKLHKLDRRDLWSWRLTTALLVALTASVIALWGYEDFRLLPIFKHLGPVQETARVMAPALIGLVVVFCLYVFLLQRQIRRERFELIDARIQDELRHARTAARAANPNGNTAPGVAAAHGTDSPSAHLLITPNQIDVDGGSAAEAAPRVEPPSLDPAVESGRGALGTPRVIAIDPDLMRFDSKTAATAKPTSRSEPATAPAATAPEALEAESLAVIDRDAALAYTKGQRALLRQVANLYWQESPRQLDELSRAITGEDAYAAQRSAYRLKGNLSRLGGRAAARAAARLESLAADGDLSTVRAHLPELQFEIQRFETELAAFVDADDEGEARAATAG